MIKKVTALFLALLVISSMSLLGQDKSLRTKAPLKTEPIDQQDIRTPRGTDIPVTAANFVAVDTMSNTYGPASPTLNPIAFDPISGVLALVHRGNANTYAQGSGELWWNYSTDMGTTWPRSSTSVQNNTTSQILARYPSMCIVNKTGTTTLADLWGVFTWPELASSFAYIGWGVTIGMEFSAFAEINFDPPNYGSNVPCWTDNDYIYWVSDNQDSNSIRLFRTQDFSVVEFIDPPTWAGSLFSNGNITFGGVAYDGVIYTAVSGTFADVIGLGGWEVGYCKSTDQGTTWSDWFVIDWHDFPAFADYEELWDWKKDDGFVSYAGDIQVDKDGMVHLLFGITNLADSADERGYNAIVEFYETSEGVWDYYVVAEGMEDVNDLSLYEGPLNGNGDNQDPAVGQCGPSFFLATNEARDFFVAQYNIAIYEAGMDSIPCEMFYQTRALDETQWGPRVNITETPEMNEDGGHLAPDLATVDNGDGTFTDYAFSGFWYEAGNTTRYVDPLQPTVFYVAPVAVRTYTSVGDDDVNTLTNYSLGQNYPNPFNPSTKIDFTIPSGEFVTLKVYDILGNEVASLVNEERNAGLNSVVFDASNLASGMYVYTINAGQFTSSKKMLLLK